jgi:outer membrane protein assembly factor BamC
VNNRLTRLLVWVLAVAATAGCTLFDSVDEKRKIDYQTSRRLPPLEIPPDLTGLPASKDAPIVAPGTRASATYSDYASDKKTADHAAGVLPESSDIRVEREGGSRWLVVKGEPDTLWPRIRQFVQAHGLLIARENAQTGVIETDWAENRATVGTGVQRILSKHLASLYSTGMRDRFRIRLERGREPGSTEIYLAHQGMQEVVASNDGEGVVTTLWQPRPSDPELEIEMMRLLMAHLGVKDPQVAGAGGEAQGARARLTRNGNRLFLNVQDDLDRAWRRVGLSLDRTGFTVEDRDRSKGIYYVRYIDPETEGGKKPGFFSRLFGAKEKPKKEEYRVQLTTAEGGTQVEVLGKDGSPEQSKTGERILSLLHEQLK